MKDEQGETIICSSAKDKARALCTFFSSVFNSESVGDFELLPDITGLKESTPIIITDDVLSRLSKLNINKSEGPDLIHPRIIYEIRHEITHPLIFNRSLVPQQIPEIWKCANITPVYKKGRKDEVNNYTVCLKKTSPTFLASCNSRKHRRIFIMFGTHVSEKVSNQ